MTLTKKDIIEKVLNVFELEPKRIRHSRYNRYDALFEIIKETLAKEEDILISGFGKFCIKRKNARMGHNPAAYKRMILKKRRVYISVLWQIARGDQ